MQSCFNEEKILRQKFENQCQEKERQISMLTVDFRQLSQHLQKVEGELRQENEKTKALKVQIEEEIQINVKKKSNKSINNYVIKFTKN